MTFDPLAYKKEFPVFTKHPKLAYLDTAATALKPTSVIDAVEQYYAEFPANVHRGLYDLSETATRAFEKARATIAATIGAKDQKEVIFVRNATEGINLFAQSWGATFLKAGNEIIISIAEHHSNFIIWQQLAKELDLTAKIAPLDANFQIDVQKLESLITPRTKLIAIQAASNVLGTIHPIEAIIALAKQKKITTLVDAAQIVPHVRIDVQKLGCDALVFSGHKTYGPTGIGVLWAHTKLLEAMPPFLFGGEMISEVHERASSWAAIPQKFEAGTPDIAGAIALGVALEFTKQLYKQDVFEHEQGLARYAIEKLREVQGLTLFGPTGTKSRLGVVAFRVTGVHPHDIASYLNQSQIAVRAGFHCAQPLHERYKIGPTVRASFGCYTTREDIDRLVEVLFHAQKLFAR